MVLNFLLLFSFLISYEEKTKTTTKHTQGTVPPKYSQRNLSIQAQGSTLFFPCHAEPMPCFSFIWSLRCHFPISRGDFTFRHFECCSPLYSVSQKEAQANALIMHKPFDIHYFLFFVNLKNIYQPAGPCRGTEF